MVFPEYESSLHSIRQRFDQKCDPTGSYRVVILKVCH